MKIPTDTDNTKLTLIENTVIFFMHDRIEIKHHANGVTVFSEGY